MERELRTANRLSGDRLFPACLARPRISQPDKNGRACKTDVVLLSYAEQLRSLVAGRGDLVDLGTTGLRTGARRGQTLEEFISLSKGDSVDTGIVCGGNDSQPGESGTAERFGAPAPVSAHRLRSLLANELERVYEVQERILGRLAGAEIPGAAPDSQPKEIDPDYLLLGTPYRSVSNEATQRTVLAAARFFSMRIHRSIEALCENG